MDPHVRHLRMALKAGYVKVSASKVAQALGCSESSVRVAVRGWLEDTEARSEMECSIRRLLGGRLPRTGKTAA